MTQYVEPTLRTRQLFFLAAILWAGLALLASHLDRLLPPLSEDLSVAFNQTLERSLVATVLSTLFWAATSLIAIQYTRRAVRSRQWPPSGMTVPFRTKVIEIKNPRNAWIYLAALLSLFSIQVAVAWASYSKQREHFKELKEIVSDIHK